MLLLRFLIAAPVKSRALVTPCFFQNLLSAGFPRRRRQRVGRRAIGNAKNEGFENYASQTPKACQNHLSKSPKPVPFPVPLVCEYRFSSFFLFRCLHDRENHRKRSVFVGVVPRDDMHEVLRMTSGAQKRRHGRYTHGLGSSSVRGANRCVCAPERRTTRGCEFRTIKKAVKETCVASISGVILGFRVRAPTGPQTARRARSRAHGVSAL
jgi:hypothetical protein